MGSGPLVPSAGQVGPVVGGNVLETVPSEVAEPRGIGMVVGLSSIPLLTSKAILGKDFYFQCAPLDTMPQDYTWAWADYETIDGTTHSNPQSIALDTYSFSSLFVSGSHRFAFVKGQDVLKLVKALRKIGDEMTPFQLQFGQPALHGTWDVVTAVTMRSLHVEERHGEVDARYFTITFSSYDDAPRNLTPAPVPSVGRSFQSASQPQRPGVIAVLDAAQLPQDMRTFAALSKAYYHDPTLWPVIAKASGIRDMSQNRDLLDALGSQEPSPRIVIPDLRQAQ